MDTGSSACAVESSDTDAPPSLSDVTRRLLELDEEGARRSFLERSLRLFAADVLLPYLKDESERYFNIDHVATLRLAESLMAAADLADHAYYRALGQMAFGEALRFIGRYEDAVTALDEAGESFLALGNEVGWARTRTNWLWVSHYLGRGEAALAVVDRAREILVAHQLWMRAANLDYNTAHVCRELGRLDRALALYDSAQAIYGSLGASAELHAAYAKTARANLLIRTGDFRTALRLHEEARQVYVRRADTLSVLKQEANIAAVYAAQGHYTRALRHAGSALRDMQRAGSEIDASWVALEMIECYLSLNRNEEALDLAEETVQRFERVGTPTETAKARFCCALAHARAGHIERSLTLLEEAAHAFAASGLYVHVGLAMLQRASLYLDSANWSAASREADRAQALFFGRGLPVRGAQARLVQARAALALGDENLAASLARSSLAIAGERDVLWLAHEGRHILGAVAEASGDFQGALEEYKLAVASIERMQSSLAIDLRSNFLEDKLQVYQDAIAVSLRLSQPHLAFACLERAKSRALVDYLASNLEVQIRARDGASQELLDTLARLREEHNWFYNRLYGYGLAQRTGAKAEDQEDQRLQAAVQDREKSISRIIERLALERTEGLAIAPTPSLEDSIRPPELADDTVLLEYYLRSDTSIVFVVTPEGLMVESLPVRPADIQRLLHQWRTNLAAAALAIAGGTSLNGLGRSARGILAALYRALVEPVAHHLAGYRRLVVVPYGPTHAAPFHALFDGKRHLLEATEVTVCPSSSLLRLCTDRPRRGGEGALIVAFSDSGRLPFVLEEAQAVARLMPGELCLEQQATRTAVIDSAPRRRVLHLAAHAEARLDNPAFAHLKLADGQLSTIDVFNLELQGALVTLSACETGRSVVTGGDELMGLSRGFLYAGASTLVQSLWRVEDGSTARLMEGFYRALCAGLAKGAALRQAQLDLLGDNGAHPYKWAPFQLVGDGGPL